jgi:hypothetical protein
MPGKRSNGVLCGQESETPHLLRVNLNNVRSMKMKNWRSIILLCGLLAGCTPAPDVDGYQSVILPASKAEFLASDAKELDYWTPTDADVAEAAAHIKAFLAKQSPSLASQLSEYRCQYFGITVDGKRRLYCNFFRRGDWDDGWETEPVIVFDGGDDFFQLEYDLESRQCLNFQVNGEA